jgi:hypothetical protein
MNFGRHSQIYESEFGLFIDALKRAHPELEEQQRQARAIWWDRPPLSPPEIDRAQSVEVKLKPYSYYD